MDSLVEFLPNIQVVFVAVLTFASVVALGGAVVAYKAQRRNLLETRLHGRQSGQTFQLGDSSDSGYEFLARLGLKLGAGSGTEAMHTRMVRAGYQSRNAVAVFIATKFLLFLGSLLVLVPVLAILDITFTMQLLIAMAGSGIVFLLPNFYIDSVAKRRAQEVQRHLPDMVDLLEVCVSGGMGLDQAWNAVGNEIRQVSPLLADEMVLTTLEMQLGEERGAALRHMATRTGADDLSSMVSALVQSQRFGTSVSQALRVFAENMREIRSTRAEERAETMTVKMLFPMILFIFPVVIMVAVGPAAMSIIEMFQHM